MPKSSAPRAYTVEEMRERFLQEAADIARYWAQLPSDFHRKSDGLPDLSDVEKELVEKYVKRSVEGAIFSLLVMLDGGHGFMPAFNLSPAPHPTDADFHKDRGENWWDGDVVINDCQLHEKIHSHFNESVLAEMARGEK